LIWKYTTEGPVHATPAIDDEHVYISGCDGAFRAIDTKTGRQAYTINLASYAGASAAIWEGYAYVGTFGNEVFCLNLRRRIPEWSYSHPTRHFPFYSSAAVGGDRIVVGGRDKIVHCLERSTGKELWSLMTKARVESSPLVTGNRVFIGSNDGLFYELDLTSGEKVWEFTSGAPFSASPAAVQGFLVIGDQDGVLYCFGN
jgi:outer membrane protein assembly factor BamB